VLDILSFLVSIKSTGHRFPAIESLRSTFQSNFSYNCTILLQTLFQPSQAN
jgi:hypothetical protein